MLWIDLYKSCVSETNPDKLEKLIYQTEGAIFLRSQELSTEHRLSEEVRALKEAAQKLLKLKIEKLGWPDPLKINTELTKLV
jgi:hypothetical protein